MAEHHEDPPLGDRLRRSAQAATENAAALPDGPARARWLGQAEAYTRAADMLAAVAEPMRWRAPRAICDTTRGTAKLCGCSICKG